MRLFAASVLCVLAVQVAGQEVCPQEPIWSYCETSATGPQHWAALRQDWRACAGNNDGFQQSPIQIPTRRRSTTHGPLHLEYVTIPSLKVTNTGHAIKMPEPYGVREYLYLSSAPGIAYELKEFHFHVPAEHMNPPGIAPVGELHLVHRRGSVDLAVAIFLELGDADNEKLEPIISALPLRACCAMTRGALDLAGLVKASDQDSFIYYVGSLTTPRCTRVEWYILPKTISISQKQLDSLNMFGSNARPARAASPNTVYCYPASATCPSN
jgi:carbonic anhydrase